MYNTIIGIDPAFRQSGFAICILDLTEKTANFKVFKNGFNDFFFWEKFEAPDTCFWAVENSNLQADAVWGKRFTFKNGKNGREYRIEGMGDGRYRLHSAKRQPKQK